MRALALVFGLALLGLVAFLALRINEPGPNVGKLDGLAILRLMDGAISAPDYCHRRGLPTADAETKAAIAELAKNYESLAPAARSMLQRQFEAVPPARERELAQARKFMQALQQNPSLVTEPSFRPQLVIISEFLARQCLQLARPN